MKRSQSSSNRLAQGRTFPSNGGNAGHNSSFGGDHGLTKPNLQASMQSPQQRSLSSTRLSNNGLGGDCGLTRPNLQVSMQSPQQNSLSSTRLTNAPAGLTRPNNLRASMASMPSLQLQQHSLSSTRFVKAPVGLTRPQFKASMASMPSLQQHSLYSAKQTTNAPPGKNNAQATAAGRSLLNRPRGPPESIDVFTEFTASSAYPHPPIQRVTTDLTLKSCLSSGSMLSNSSRVPGSVSENKNEEFKMARNVSFSHEQVREYEVTLGDNPSVSSGPPVSLGWRYNPQERISPLDNNNKNNTEKKFERSSALSMSMSNMLMRAPVSSLKRLSDRERHRRVNSNPNVSMEDLSEALESIAVVRLERRESLNQLREEMVEKKRQENGMLIKERGLMRQRRMGI